MVGRTGQGAEEDGASGDDRRSQPRAPARGAGCGHRHLLRRTSSRKRPEHRIDHVAYEKLITATDNDAYNTLVATDLAPEFGRENVYQLKRVKQASSRHALPATLGGRAIGADETFFEVNARVAQGCEFRTTKLSEEFTLDHWRETLPDATVIADVGPNGTLRLLGPEDTPKDAPGTRILSLTPKKPHRNGNGEENGKGKGRDTEDPQDFA